ncbi:hypothetical protein CTheo_6987 [Ceratobasidium theobromae]|uniref:Uncharacterized protein n=1 Tax=Ceratobasidium theobromae TaxID=1582974 RepID=A0A5N5QDN0_9AGAM|nr:hypothetical protein CTheo_6987 [Ceratobasidium theobromae]
MSSENTASVICQIEAAFKQWAKSIHLDQEIYQDLPDELQGLLEASRKFPAWLGDPDADQFKPYRKIFAVEITNLQRGLARRTTDVVSEQTDPETAEQLSLVLPLILSIPLRYLDLLMTAQICGQANQAEIRTAVDQLLNHAWRDKGAPNFVHLLERKLQLPESYAEGSICVTETTSDSIVLFWHPGEEFPSKFLCMPLEAPALSCLARKHTLAVLHWATEYTQDDALAASRQTRMAMVSGLYQRRALGFIDHFVFGTAHSGNRLEVFAGRWEPVESPDQETGASPAEQDAPTQDTTPPGALESALRSSNKPPNGSTSNLPKRDKYEIKIYQFPEYSPLSSLDMVEYYMLMRASRDLACKYAADIFSDQYGKVHSLAVENCTWPGDSPRSEQKSTGGSQNPTLEIIKEGRRVRANFLLEHDGTDEWEFDDEGRLHLVNGGGPDWSEHDDGTNEWEVDDEGRLPLMTDQLDSDQIVQAYLRGLARDKPADPVVEDVD